MKALSDFVVRCFDLIEAEGSSLRTAVRTEARRAQNSAAGIVMASVVLVVALSLCGAGVWLMGSGLLWWLQTQMSRPLAASLTGMVALVIGIVFLVYSKVLAGRRHS